MTITPIPRSAASTNVSQQLLVYAAVAVITLAVALLYASVIRSLVSDWLTDPAQSHGILIPPLALYMGWLKRRQIMAQPAHHDARGLIAVGAGCVMFLAGRLGAEFFLTRLSLVVVLTGVIWTYSGIARVRAIGFPLLLLSTMIPIPAIVYNSLVSPLQLLASTTGTLLARMYGIAIYQDGNVINLAGIALGVDEACSGLHSLMALAIAGLVLGYVSQAGAAVRFALFCLALPISIAANIIRVAGTAILADTNERFAMGFYHSFSGWLVFVFGFVCLFGIAKLLAGTGRRTG